MKNNELMMNFQNLTKTQKTVLAWVVNQVETGEMEESFTVIESLNKRHCVYITPDRTPKRIDGVPMSLGTLESICRAGFLTCSPHVGQTRGLNCTLTEAAYQIVKPASERNFEINEMFLHGAENIPLILRRDVPNCDEVIIKYTEEAILCVTAKAWLAAAIMVGAASEKAILLLIDTYANAITSKSAKEKFKNKTNGRWISSKFESFKQSYHGCKNKPKDQELDEGFTVAIEQTFQLCRLTRNKIGHPQIVPTLREGQIISSLNYFPEYIQLVYKLMDYFEENGVEL